tara:strand:- start:1565 stop:2143 length:579 start_codon:yes stop_codon:yes gene_type:complete
MKNLIVFLTLILTIFLLTNFKDYLVPHQPSISIKVNPIPIKPIKVLVTQPILSLKSHSQFLKDIGFKESGNRYEVVNQYGYMGKYQFGKSTLRTLKIKVTKYSFLNNPDLQESAMKKNLQYNKKRLKKYIDKYEGKIIYGILITESGVLAAAHLGGSGNVRKFFRKGKVFEDGNGTKITHYMKLFSGYTLNL